MNVRLKLANNEQKTCTIKMAENSSVVGADRIVEEAGADLVENDIEEICTTAEVGKTETVSAEENDKESTTTGCEHPESESEDSTDEKDDDVVSAVNVMKVKAITLNRRFHWPQLFQ